MELSSLKFATDTKELLDAKKAIDDLAKSMQNLNKVQQDEAKSAKVEQEVIKESGVTWKKFVADRMSAYMKLEGGHAAAMKRMSIEWKNYKDSAIDSSKGTDTVTESVKKSTTVLERQQSILEYMTQGFSKGQASVLTYAKASGALATDLKQLEDVLLTQRKLMGGDPFDKSMSGIVALKNQYGEIREAIRQYNAETGLSREQTRELARDKERIIEKMKLEGASLSDIKQAIRNYNQAYTEAATKVNALTTVEKDRERALRDTANASRNVQAAEERLFATVAHLNDGVSQNSKLNERAALALGSYERNLRLAGITGEDAAKKLAKFKAAQEQVAAAEANTRSSYISRGIGVQMGDIGVSLASGMNPLTVAIQQGDQIRGLIQQSGLEAAQMGKVMQQAFAGIVTSFKDVGIAMGSFVVGGLKTMGDATIGIVGKISGLSTVVANYKSNVLEAGPPTKGMSIALGAMEAAGVVAGVAVAGLLVSLGLYAIVVLKAIKEQEELNRTLIFQGTALGTSTDAIYTQAIALKELGVRQGDTIAVVSEMAKAGKLSSESIEQITVAAVKMRDYGGVAIEETVKNFSELAKEPVSAAEKLNEKYGYLTASIYLQIKALEEQGNVSEAARVSQEAYANMIDSKTKTMDENLGILSKGWKALGDAAKNAWDSMLNIGRNNPEEELQKALATMQGKGFLEGGLFSGSKEEALSIIRLYEARTEAIKKSTEEQIKNNSSAEGAIALSRLSSEFADKSTKKQLELNKAHEAYRKALAGAAGDTELQIKLAKQYETTLAGINKKFEEKPKRGSLAEGKLNADDNALATLQAKLLASEKEYAIISLTGDAQYKLSEADKERMKIQEQINALKEKGTVGLNAKQVQAQQDQLQNLQEQLKVSNQLTEQQKRLNMLRLETQLDEDLKVLKMFPDEREREIKFIQYRNQIIKDGGTLNEEEAKRLRERIDTELELNKVIQYRDQFIKNSSAEKQKDFGRQVQGVEAATKSGTFSEGDRATFANTTLSNMGVENTRLQTEAQLEIYRNYYAQLDLLLQKNLISEQDYSSAKAQLVVKENKTRYQAFDNLLTGMASLQNSSVREMAALGKVAAVVQATINTYEGATKALAQGGIMGPVMAAVVIAQGMAQVAAIKSQGFADGGYTGSGGKYDPAGIVHKGEIVWSQEDIAKAGGVSAVENMRKGIGGYSSGISSSASSTSKMQSSGVSVSIENYGTSKDFEVQQLSETEIRIIARDEAKDVVRKDAPNVVANQIRNPNSNVSKSLSQNTKTQRRR